MEQNNENPIKKSRSKLKIFSLDLINLTPDVTKSLTDEFDAKYAANPDLPFYGLMYKNGRPTIIVSKKSFSHSNKKEYYAQLSRED